MIRVALKIAVPVLFVFAVALVSVGPESGWLSGAGIALGAAAYALMALNIVLALRRPIVERWFGPLDRVYMLHRFVGMATGVVIGAHLLVIPVAALRDRDTNLLDEIGPPILLGVLGLLLSGGSIALALSGRMSYSRWQRVHMAVAGAFVVLTAHAVAASSSWDSLTAPLTALLAVVAVTGFAGLAFRLWEKFRGGTPYFVETVTPRERAVELSFRPRTERALSRAKAGQFAFLTASVSGATETHPFTLVGDANDHGCPRMLIRSAGDWTGALQTGIQPGDEVRLSGPFGGFLPSSADPQRPQIWIAGGSGITPFLATIRTWGDGRTAPVHLVFAAQSASDAPGWEELQRDVIRYHWLSITPIFSAEGRRIDGPYIQHLAATAAPETAWYLCGPASLTTVAREALGRAGIEGHDIHFERYSWRDSRSRPLHVAVR